jgi:hypothetical protein
VITARRSKKPDVFVFYDDEEDAVVGRYSVEELQRNQKQAIKTIESLDIVGKNARLLEWARMAYLHSAEGRMLESAKLQLTEIESKLAMIAQVKNG